jgi:hypothetical protein
MQLLITDADVIRVGLSDFNFMTDVNGIMVATVPMSRWWLRNPFKRLLGGEEGRIGNPRRIEGWIRKIGTSD